MTRVLVNETLRSLLHNLCGPLELCDESGRVLGRVFPTLDLSQYEPWEPPFSEDELRRQEQAGEKRYTTAEVLARLIPVLDHSQYEPVEPQIPEEELQRRRQEPDYSTAEVMTYLEKLS